MSDPMQNLNDAADALNQVAARAAGFYDDADAEISARQAAYDGLAANLRGVVNNQMDFFAVIDPLDPAPTNLDGGKFNTIEAAIAAAPLGSRVTLNLTNDLTFVPAADIDLGNRTLRLRPVSYAGTKPTLQLDAYASATYNLVRGFRLDGGGLLDLSYVNLALPNAKADTGLPWATSNGAAVLSSVGAHARVRFAYGTITGGEGRALVSGNGGQSVDLAIYSAILDGSIYAVNNAASGVVSLAKGAITLQNGAALTDGGTLGANFLQN